MPAPTKLTFDNILIIYAYIQTGTYTYEDVKGEIKKIVKQIEEETIANQKGPNAHRTRPICKCRVVEAGRYRPIRYASFYRKLILIAAVLARGSRNNCRCRTAVNVCVLKVVDKRVLFYF